MLKHPVRNKCRNMEYHLDILLERLLFTYPSARGVSFHSMDLPVTRQNGSKTETLEKYKDIPMMSIDEAFNTRFTFIVTEDGTIIIFFIKRVHFVSVLVDGETPNKELATRMYETFRPEFETAVDKLYEA